MTSDTWRPRIDRYLDSELSEEEMRSMDAHLQECASCAAEALRQVQLKHATWLAGRHYVPSPEFRRRISEQVGARRRTGWGWGWKPAFAAAVIAVIVAGIGLIYWSKEARSGQILTELADIHVANLAASTPVDVVSSDRHTVKPWFQGKVPFTFNLPEVAGSPFSLVGGRLTYLNHEPGAQLIYDISTHHISVFIFRDAPDLADTFSAQQLSREVLKFYVESWSANGLRYFAVGDASPASIRQLAGMLKQAGNS
jgi:anti-sigma factor RsiW